MKKAMRLLVFSGALALMASPVFADGGSGSGNGSGPGGTVPPPPPTNTTTTTTSTGTSGTTIIVTEILTVLGAVGL